MSGRGPDDNGPEGGDKPASDNEGLEPYESKFNYLLSAEDAEAIWAKLNKSSDPISISNPLVFANFHPLMAKLNEGKLQLSLKCRSSQTRGTKVPGRTLRYSDIKRVPLLPFFKNNNGSIPENIKTFETLLRAYIKDNLRFKENGEIVRVNEAGIEEHLVTLPIYVHGEPLEFVFSPDKTCPPDANQFKEELNTAMGILRIYITELYNYNRGLVPEETLIIGLKGKGLPPDADLELGDISAAMERIDATIKEIDEVLGDVIKTDSPGGNGLIDQMIEDALGEFAETGAAASEGSPGLEQGYSENPPGRKKTGLDGKKDNPLLKELRNTLRLQRKPEQVSFDEIGGQEKAVQICKDLAEQLNDPQAFLEWGVAPPRGILFHGAPGSGKTLLARALAYEAKVPFIYIKASDIIDKMFGDSEKLTDAVFTIAEELSDKEGGCIIYFDEIETLFPSRNDDHAHEAKKAMLGIVLQKMDGITPSKGITIVASTNYPNVLDKALLDRMNNWVEVPLPGPDGIKQIFKIQLEKAQKLIGRKILADDLDLDKITEAAHGLSGRNIRDIVQDVLAFKAREQKRSRSQPAPINTDDLLKVLERSSKRLLSENELKDAAAKRKIGFL